ncbi:hypothetical protein A5819_003094 [Enterococcus sp. 7E2_DIV0204]|uniref:asparagine synthase-related protein n=3 Tax=unclassified Enterococcus TaxID=2608891 RepID=UPI000B7261AE|nr:asparagine synthase-related protein [Enterococcus sp. 7E2_DIV0204]OTN90594.1 hypothetical protein A5819_003094 [Enterococcus sp. 7E2_DIV0204]
MKRGDVIAIHLENQTLFQIKIKVSNSSKSILLVSKYKYSKYIVDGMIVYSIPSEYDKVANSFKNFNEDALIDTARIFQKNISKGIFILIKDANVIMGAPIFDSSLAWMLINNELVISDTINNIAIFFNLPLSKSALGLHLINSLPYYPFQNVPLWEGVNVVDPFCVLHYINGRLDEVKTWQSPVLNNDVNSTYKMLREHFLNVINHYIIENSQLTADLSGGVDSATIVYLLKSLNANFKLYHSMSDSKVNSDSKWAQLIANDINHSFTTLNSVGSSGKRFEANLDYPNGVLTDYPLLWADSEGYASSIAESNLNPSIHLMGLGGDELFSPMPAYAWSRIREKKMRSFSLGLRYCLLSRTPIITGMIELMNKTSFKNAVKLEVNLGFDNQASRKKRSNLNWCGPIRIPTWLTETCQNSTYELALETIDAISDSLDLDRSRHQTLESIIFQRRVVNQLNKAYEKDKITWEAPFLDFKIVDSALSIPISYRQDQDMTKATLYYATKGITPRDIFTRGFKGDYSEGMYESYKKATKYNYNQIRDFKLVDLGLVDPDKLLFEQSMPTALDDRIESFDRLSAVERWLRIVMRHQSK